MGTDIEIILESLRQNSVILAREHKKRYLELKIDLEKE